jgi:hypothetical protein
MRIKKIPGINTEIFYSVKPSNKKGKWRSVFLELSVQFKELASYFSTRVAYYTCS